MLQTYSMFILFYVVLCSASKLEHFENVFEKQYAQVFFSGIEVQESFEGQNLSETAAGCSEVCYNCKYFCDLFIIIEEDPFNHECFLYNMRASSLVTYPLIGGLATRAIYQLSERKDVEPLEKRFSYDYRMNLDDWVTNLETGYFISNSIPEDVLTGAVKAMNRKPSTAIDFDKWVSSKDTSQSQRMPFELGTFTGRKIMQAVKEWEQFTNGNKQASTEYFDTLLLTFLDIFCPCLQPDVTTVYDPVKKVVFIRKEDLDMFVVSYGPGDFAIVRNIPKKDQVIQVSVSDPGRLLRMNCPGNPVELFEKANGKRYSKAFYVNIGHDTENAQIDPLLNVLNNVLCSLSDSGDRLLFTYSLSGPLFIFYRDLMIVVLSSVYKNDESRFFTLLEKFLTRKLYSDISVSTLHESE